jgi:hypothetical protein
MNNHIKILNEIQKIFQKYSIKADNKFVYHFTNGKALQNIIESNELWLCERNYMNDVLDEKYTRNLISSIILNGNIKNEFSEKQIQNLFFINTPQYTFSTSLEGDLLNQWIYYGSDNAYCIEFDNDELRKYFECFLSPEDTPGDRLYGGPIIYEESSSVEILTEIVNKYKNRYFSKDDTQIFDIKKFFEGEKFRYIFEYFYCFIKQHGNYCEYEYRYLLKTERKPKFSIKRGMFVPYISIGGEAKGKIPIKRIIIGPSNNEEQAEKGLRFFLDTNDYKDTEITRSKLKIRP